MKVGDLVIINVPPVGKLETCPSCQGVVVDKIVYNYDKISDDGRNRVWWYVLRSDTGTIEKFHDDWLDAAENGSW